MEHTGLLSCFLFGALILRPGLTQTFDEIKFIGVDGPAPLFNFEEMPTCTSYKSLCRISMNISTLVDGRITGQKIPHERQHCACPNNVTCPTNMEENDRRSMRRVFRSKGQIIRTRMDYCSLKLPERKCLRNEPVFTLRGNGPFMLEIYGDFNCYCKRELFAHKSWSEGMYNFVQYSCGKPRCHILQRGRDNTDSICMTIRNNRNNNSTVTKPIIQLPDLTHEYKCRCRYYEECVVVGELPVKVSGTAKDWYKLKEDEDDNENWMPFETEQSCVEENIVVKGEIACYKQFLLFPQCFLKYKITGT